jgi:hypothetical protein
LVLIDVLGEHGAVDDDSFLNHLLAG